MHCAALRFAFEGPGRKKAMEEAWLASAERAGILADMSTPEKKRRRYI